ncbi:MAG TPA: class I SAM-dependent rRNA methyltransferase [Anaerolineae bacterium]|nr:class I SAM-dependent rRNA methyltransferase [Anaerolineae bacterium]
MGGQVVLRHGREKPVRLRHPWIFSGAIQRMDGDVPDGGIADVVSAQGEFLARGYVNRRSQIAVRLLTWDENEPIDTAFWRFRLERAIRARPEAGSACRLVNAESDGLPGLVVDRYGAWIVVQALTLGIEHIKQELVDLLEDLTKAQGIYERSDVDVREKEGLPQAKGCLHGEEPPDEIEIAERGAAGQGLRFLVDVKRGHKTGFYLDQSENRRKVAAYCKDAEVLNLFSYTGAFACHALVAGARRAVNVESSAEALALARRNVELNGFPARDEDFVEGDAFGVLRQFRAEGRTFDVIIADPPKFVHTAGQIERASRAYKDLNLVSMQILRPGGTLATFSCSGLVSPDLFQKIVFGASLDAGRNAQIVEKLSQSSDHPILLSFPEAEYLKGLVCRVW